MVAQPRPAFPSCAGRRPDALRDNPERFTPGAWPEGQRASAKATSSSPPESARRLDFTHRPPGGDEAPASAANLDERFARLQVTYGLGPSVHQNGAQVRV